jgi:hypothetical protein
MVTIDFKKLKVEKNNEELAKLIRRDIDEALALYNPKFMLWNECFLEFHGINAKQFYQGDNFYFIETQDSQNRTVQKKIYDRPVKLRVAYSAVNTGMAQVNRSVPDFMSFCDDFAIKDLDKMVTNLVSAEWERSKAQLQIDLAWWNAFLFGEMIFRNYYVEERRDKNEVTGVEDEEKVWTLTENKKIYEGVKLKMVNSFEFIPSPEWKNDIQEAPWLSFRTFKTAEEILRLYPDDFKSLEEVQEANTENGGLSEYKVLDPYALVRKVYETKVDPETRELMSGMLRDMGTDTLGVLPDNLVEVNEYFRKDIDARIVMVGHHKIVEAEHMDDDFYPVVAHKTNMDALTPRGIGDVEQALPLTKTVDDMFDLKMKNLALQLASVLVYNTAYFQQTPSFGPGTAMGVRLRPGDSFDNVMAQVNKYSQNFEITKEQKDFEAKIFVLMGLNEYLAGTPQAATNATAREAVIRNSAATANLDYKMKRVENDVYTEIANQWAVYISEYYDANFVFSLAQAGETKYFLFLGDVEVDDENEDYVTYKYKGKKFWEPKIGQNVLDNALDSFSEATPQESDLSIGNPAGELSLGGMPPGPGPEMNPIPETEAVPENVVGKWTDFVMKVAELTEGKIVGIVTRAELKTLAFKFRIRATQGILMNRNIKKQELIQLIPFVAQLQNAQATYGMIKSLVELFQLPSEYFNLSEEQLQQSQQAMGGAGQQGGPQNAQTTAEGQTEIANQAKQAPESTISFQNLPGNPSPNPSGQ